MLNRISFPDEFRGPTMFLLSDVSRSMTAAYLRVDGGHGTLCMRITEC
jgi:enoyl-[acyl-carrier-protein] reductase (NADH)